MSAIIIPRPLYTRWLMALIFLVMSHQGALSTELQGSFQFLDGKRQVEIPFHTFNNQIILRVEVNRKIPLNFLLDTGSKQAILFDPKLAKALNIERGRNIRFSGVGKDRRVGAYRSTGVILGLPGIEGERMGLVVLKKDYLALGDYDIQGILGYQFFYRFAITIDYKTRIMTVTDPTFFQADPETPSFDIDLSSVKPVLKAKAGFDHASLHSSNLLVDTGASYAVSLLFDSSPAFPKMKINGQLRNIGKGLGGVIKGKLYTVQLQLKKQNYTLTAICLSPKHYSRKGKVAKGINGAIGGEFLRNFIVTFNYSKGKIYLKPQFEESFIAKTGN